MWIKYNHFDDPQIKSRWLIKEKDITIIMESLSIVEDL